MKRKHVLGEQLILEIIERKNRTTVNIIDRGIKRPLARVKTSEYFFCKVKLSASYLVVYTRGCMVNNIPLVIEAAYSITTREIVNLDCEKTRSLLDYMVVSRTAFDIAEVLQAINKADLEIVEQEKKYNLKRYLTADTTHFTEDEVMSHILKAYPWLVNYTNLSGPISVIGYRNLIKEIQEKAGEDLLRFHIMPLPPSYLASIDIPCKEHSNVDYRDIYLSEEGRKKQ